MDFFIDSSIIIEGLKGSEKALNVLKFLFERHNVLILYINSVVISEVIYQLHGYAPIFGQL